MKTCNRCQRTFELTPQYWHKDRTRPDGWDRLCKDCKYQRRYERYHRDPEAAKAAAAQWAKDNPDSIRAHSSLRRARKFVNGPPEVIKFIEVYHRDGGVCGLCHEIVEKDLPFPNPGYGTIDHIVPLSRGGPHTYSNVQLAHSSCNSRKGNRI